METSKPTVFLSYRENDSPIADMLAEKLIKLTNSGIKISRYTDLKYRDSFKEFMNTVPDHDFVICIVSDEYLKSYACMYEVGEVIKDHHFKNKLIFIVLQECDRKYYGENADNLKLANIYHSEENRLNYVKYWKERYKELRKQIDSDIFIAATNSIETLKKIKKIYEYDIGQFIAYLADANGKSFSELYDQDFSSIIKCIIPSINIDIFKTCTTYKELLHSAILEICKITKTDYNQIALYATTTPHQSGLVVFADNIPKTKQNYRFVIRNGVMTKAYDTGEVIIVKDSSKDTFYFNAVEETLSELVVPISIAGNRVGVINSESEKADYYSERMISEIKEISNCLSVALQKLKYAPSIDYKSIPYIQIN